MKPTKASHTITLGVLGLLAGSLLSLGCGSGAMANSERSITGPSSTTAFNAAPDSPDNGASFSAWNKGKKPSGSGLLKGASGFAVFAASTITNTGPTVVNGDIGLTPGSAVTGFPPGTLNGTLRINDAVATQAKLDLQAAYNDLAGRACNTVEPVLNSTLSPGVYCFPSSAELNTALVLNGGGNPNAVFVFQIGSTLTTASNSSVTLINGASAANVFWQVGSSATLGTNTAFQGTIIAYSSVTLNTGASIVRGRAMALNGAVTMDTNVITRPDRSGRGGRGGRGGHGGGNGDDGDDDDDGDDKGHHRR